MTDRPLLLLDVDGPLNPYAANPNKRPTGYTTHRLRPQGWTDPRRRPLRVWLNPAHGEQLLALPFDLVWCTTWVHEANTMIGPVLGLPELPVIEWPENVRETAPYGVLWKTARVIEYAAGRPFAWVDDDIEGADGAYVAEHHPAPALLHYVSPRLGLLGPDFEALTAWAAAMEQPPTPAPLPPELVSAILRDSDSPYYPSQIVVFCDECGVTEVGDYMVSTDMTRAERLGVARQHLVDTKGWEHTVDGDDFCPEHASSPATVQPAEPIVAYRSRGTRSPYCVTCARQESGAQPLTGAEVSPDTVCDFCGGQVLAVASKTLGDVIARRIADEESATCGKCQQPFVTAVTGFEEHARYARSPYCRGCVYRCQSTEIADHRCVICA